MTAKRGFGSSGGGVAIAAAALGLVAVAGSVWWKNQTPSTVVAKEPVAVTPAASPSSAPNAQANPAMPSSEPKADLTAAEVAIDHWRVAADGDAVVAGKSASGAKIFVQVDGKKVAEAVAGGDGAFALLFTLAPNPQPSLMEVVAELADGRRTRASEAIALAPIVGPAVVAASEDTPAPVALVVRDSGVTLAQAPHSPMPEPSLLGGAGVQAVVLDAISYAPEGQVQFAGRGQPGHTVRLYLDNIAKVDQGIDAAGQWQMNMGDVAAGLYVARLDQLDEDGRVTARFETPFRRESLADLAQISAPVTPTVPAASPPITAPSADPLAPDLPAEPRALAPVTDAAPSASPLGQSVTITVQPGFTLWGIARESFGEGVLYVQLYEANRDKIRNPDLIYPGQVFTLPGTP